MVKQEKKNENITPSKLKIDISKLSFSIMLFKLKILTAVNIGIDIRKEILTESTLLKFKILAADIVIPDLLTPGIKDKI